MDLVFMRTGVFDAVFLGGIFQAAAGAFSVYFVSRGDAEFRAKRQSATRSRKNVMFVILWFAALFDVRKGMIFAQRRNERNGS
jgi:hypothetical protein